MNTFLSSRFYKIRIIYSLIFLLSMFDISYSLAKEDRSKEQIMSSHKKVAIIIGSTRPNRIGDSIGKWILKEVSTASTIEFTIVDLAIWNLPMFDEPGIPAQDLYVHDHTKAWSSEIKKYDAYIFLTPQYNSGYPASLKNAIDYLCKEWHDKPAIIVSYGYQGGEKAALGLEQVLLGLKMKIIHSKPALVLHKEMFSQEGRFIDVEGAFSEYKNVIKQATTELSTECR